MKVSSPGGMNLDVHAAWTRHTDTPEAHCRHAVDTQKTQCSRTVALSVRNPRRRTLRAEPSAQNPPRKTHSEETAKKHTHP